MAKLDYDAATGTEEVFTITEGATESGNTYASFSSFQSSEATDLTAATGNNKKYLLQCKGDIGRVALSSSWSMDANDFIKLEAQSGETYTITPDGNSNCVYAASSANDERLLIEDATIDAEGTASRCCDIADFHAVANISLVRCVLTDSTSNAFKNNSGGVTYMENCVIYDHANHGVEVVNGTADLFFCTLFNINSGGNGFANGVWRRGGTFTAQNVAVEIDTGGGSTCFSGSFDAASDYNAGNNTSAPGSNSQDNIVAATVWTDTSAPYDLTPVSGQALEGNGVAVTGITDDYAGVSRASPPSIGAYEPTPTGSVVPIILQHDHFAGGVL